MSHTRRKTTKKSNKYTLLFYGSLFLCLFTFLDIFAAQAHAATNSATKVNRAPTHVLKSTLSKFAGHDEIILDWRNPSFELKFDLPAHDWYETLNLFLSASPRDNVSRTSPLMISYNGAKPVPLYGRASQFDAQIRLDPSIIRSSHNSIVISYKTPSGHDCLTSAHGQWVLDLSQSKLIARARAKQRKLQIIEIEKRLAHPMTAPKRVAILAKGSNKIALEALAAQGISQRMKTLPRFQFSQSGADFTVLIGTPTQIRPFVRNKAMLSTTGVNVFVDNSARPKLVVSAKTDAEVMELTRAFARHHLPNIHMAGTSIQALYSSAILFPRPILESKKYVLSDIGDTILTSSWRPGKSDVDFNVQDAQQIKGTLLLNIISDTNMHEKSRINVNLNGQPLGFTYLNKTNKNVSFDIKQGQLLASGNQLSIEPIIEPSNAQTNCSAQQVPPNVMVSSRSKLTLDNTHSSPLTDISRFAASGAPFTTNDDTTIVLTARRAKDRASTLRFLGFAAQQFGPKLTQANYLTILPKEGDRDKNILIIGPNLGNDKFLFSAAPSALKLALKGKVLQMPVTQKLASVDRHASLDASQVFKLTARKTGQSQRLNTGGIASIFPSPYANGKLIGVISSTSPVYFSGAMHAASTINAWNAFQGSVVRWNKNTVLMAQMATPLPASFFPPKTKLTLMKRATKLRTTIIAWLESKTANHVSTVASQPPIAATAPTKTSKEPQILRGAANVPAITVTKPQISLPSHRPVATALILKTSILEKYAAAKASAMSFSTNNNWLQELKQSANTLKNNRFAWLIILAFAVFFFIGMSSPKAVNE